MSPMLMIIFCTCQFPILGHQDGFRGDEIEPRSFEYNSEYFLNLLAFSFDQDSVERWRNSSKGYRTTVGSVRATEFYFFQELKAEFEPVENSFFKVQYLQSEDFDSRYEKTNLEFRQVLKEKWILGINGELSPFKEHDDLGFMLGFKNMLRLSYNMPDFQFDQKSDEGELYLRSPRTVKIQLNIDFTKAVNLYMDFGKNLPMELESQKEQHQFSSEKTFYRGMMTWQTRTNSQVHFLFNVEDSSKNRLMLGEDQSKTYNLQRETQHFRGEYSHSLGKGKKLSFGLVYFRLDESSIFPHHSQQSQILDFVEETVYATFQHKLKQKLDMRYSLFYAQVNDFKNFINAAELSKLDHSTQIKLGTLLLYTPRKNFDIIINPTFDLDTPEFGGGNVRLQILF